MSHNTFYFFSYRPAIRFHITRRLLAMGWQKAPNPKGALFTDANLTINDEIATHFEHKHLLAALMQQHCQGMMPITYAIDDPNYQEVIAKARFETSNKNITWLLKPALLNNGDGIHCFNDLDAVKKHYQQPNRLGGPHVLQQYIANPDLIAGKKYTYRMLVVVTNYTGVYLFPQGYVNISALEFNPSDQFTHRKMHITNYVLDGEFANISQRATQDLESFDKTYAQMVAIIRCALRGLIKKFPHYLKSGNTKSFEVFGFDFMQDADNKLWLLEINQSPDAPTFEQNPMDPILWQPFWHDIIEDFVLPIALPQKKALYPRFAQIMTAKQCYSRLRSLLSLKW